ncbi:LysR substrate-binding domain-containing protein [Photobacterium sp. DNB23_23_1]
MRCWQLGLAWPYFLQDIEHNFVLTGEGFAIMPSFVIENELKSGQTAGILPELHGVTVSLYAVYQHKALMPKKVRALIDYLKSNPLSSSV